jgi:hypothetical protein
MWYMPPYLPSGGSLHPLDYLSAEVEELPHRQVFCREPAAAFRSCIEEGDDAKGVLVGPSKMDMNALCVAQ